MVKSLFDRQRLAKDTTTSAKPQVSRTARASQPDNPDQTSAAVAQQTPIIDRFLSLQRTIGNRAVARQIADRRASPATNQQAPGASVVQRFPTREDLEATSSKGSVTSTKKAEAKAAKAAANGKSIKGLSAYQKVLNAVDTYHLALLESIDSNQLKTSMKPIIGSLDIIDKLLYNYIIKHTSSTFGSRTTTVETFNALRSDVANEKKIINEIVTTRKDLLKDNTWLSAIELARHPPSIVKKENVTKVHEAVGFPISFLNNLDDNDLGLIIKADQALLGKKQIEAEAHLTAIEANDNLKDIAGILRVALKTKHVNVMRPGLSQAIADPNYKETGSALKPGEFNYFQRSLPTYINEKKTITTESIQNSITKSNDFAQNNALKTNQPFIPKQASVFEQRMAWEKKNVDISHFENLPDNEKNNITYYSATGADAINNKLRGRKTNASNQITDTDADTKANAIVSALNKLPPYTGKAFRHVTKFPAYDMLNKVGAIWTDIGFTSSTREANTLKAIDGSPAPDVIEILQSKTGRFIKPLSGFNNLLGKDENEVLFKPGTKFRVTARFSAKGNAPGTYIFPQTMDNECRSVLAADIEKNRINLIIKKVEI